MDRFIKSSTITFGGYLYQNLIGLEMLCTWLDDPGHYEWVKFEGDDDEIPKGLDDIIAMRADRQLMLLQVKFTVDPFNANNSLSWEWLLKHKPKGRSLLQKWSSALFAIGIGNVASAALLTNRLPDRQFFACLTAENYLDFDLVPSETRKRIIRQLGSEDAAAQFFLAFEFRHGHQGYLALENTLLDRYVPRHTSRHGWNVLWREAIDWAVRKNFPVPDGRITLDLLRGVLDSRRPEPISQSFRIPEGYCPPDETFSEDFIDNLSISGKDIIVLWGSPGQGKSTFLTYICTKLDEMAIPYLRHHYFLELTDTADRFSLPQVANSLMAQVEAHHFKYVQGLSDNPEKLREWIEVCANGYEAEGKRFVIIVDGLDHVWRENEHNKQPLESLFRHLFPIPKNVILVIGTQKVAEEQLPSSFPKFVQPKDWVELPRMSLAATKTWLQGQLDGNRFELSDRTSTLNKDPLTELAESFHRLSSGHPLHLTYSFEALAREQRVLTPAAVSELPACPEGDIKLYYRALWQRLSFQAKDALHLVAYAGYIWPPFGLEDCLNIRTGLLNQEIGHLFYVTEAGQVPFHGSILGFIREDSEHEKVVVPLLPSVVAWLESKAPEFHRWGWLWIFKARIGNPDDLLNCPSRSWVIDSLSKAYPKVQVVEILSEAERLAFQSRQFTRAIRFRILKVRLLNGTKFQLEDYSQLHACALTLSEDDYPLRNLSASFLTASIDQLYLIGKQYLEVDRSDDATECAEQIRKRINDRLKAHAVDDSSLEKISIQYLELVAATATYHPEKLLKSIFGFRRISRVLFQFFIQKLSKHQDLRRLLDFLPHSMPDDLRRDLDLALIRLAGVCQARLHEWPEFDNLTKHPIVNCWALLYAHNKARRIPFETKASGFDVKYQESAKKAAEDYLHALFFHALSECLELSGAKPVISTFEFKEREWLNTAVNHILVLASSAGSLLARGEYPGFGHAYRLMRPVKAPKDHDAFGDYVAFRRALLRISTDLFLLTSLRSGFSEIPPEEWRSATESKHFLFSEWLERYMADAYRILSNETIRQELENRMDEESGRVSQFNERTQNYLELCELAVFQQLDPLGKGLLVKALGCVIGYGWRKDITVSNVLDAIAAIIPADADFARGALARLCPAIANIDIITDGDDTNFTKFVMAEQLIKLMPRSYAAYYEDLLKTSEWHDAENVISRLLETEPLDSALMAFVTEGSWDSNSLGTLRRRAKNGDASATKIINDNAMFYAQLPEELGKDSREYSSQPDEDHGLDVRAYPPEALGSLLADLKSRNAYSAERKALREWFDYWKPERKAELLSALEPYLKEESVLSEVSALFDEAFELSLGLEGTRKAYRWIMAAQIHRHGWSEYYSEEESLRRFGVFARYYSSRWEDFVIDTSRPAYRGSSEQLVIPSHRLVQFLVALGQVQAAEEVAEQLVSSVVEDVSDQPLRTPTWFSGR
jgi:hypothetical protein